MITLKEKAKQDNAIMRILKLGEVRHIVAHTDKGDLCLCLFKDGTDKDYRYLLDSVPVDSEQNQEMLDLFNGVLYNI